MQSFLIALFMAIGKQLVAWGLLKGEELIAIEKRIQEAREYQKVVDKPGNTREERRRAEDDFLS